MTLRPYQVAAVDAIHGAFESHRSALVVMPTGCGKTQVFSEVIRTWPSPALVLAHREELLEQARTRIEDVTGQRVDVEQADRYDQGANIVVGSVQTLVRKSRRERFSPHLFGLVVVDEAHHAAAESYRRILEYFATAKVLGVTATPDRADKIALGAVFETVAYQYEIEDAVRDGWLCTIRQQQVFVSSLHLEDVPKHAGDLSAGELEKRLMVEETIHRMARPTLELAGERKTLVFCAGVGQAHRFAEILNRYRDGCARSLDGETPSDMRRATLEDFRRAEFQFLTNCALFLEGFDLPEIACVSMCRPTTSRALYAQAIGRGTRIAEGKTDLLVLDFVGNAGRHKLVSAVDVLGGRDPDAVRTRVRRILDERPEVAVHDALEEARAAEEEAERRREEARTRQELRVRARYSTVTVDPFAETGVEMPHARARVGFGAAPATEKQIALLTQMRVPVSPELTRREAAELITECFSRRERGLCTYAQARALEKRGLPGDVRFETARKALDALASRGWRLSEAERGKWAARMRAIDGDAVS